MIDFSDADRNELKKYFNSLDEDGSGAIGLEELEVYKNYINYPPKNKS